MSDRYQRHCGWLPEDYNRIRSGVCVGERLEGIDLDRYDEIIKRTGKKWKEKNVTNFIGYHYTQTIRRTRKLSGWWRMIWPRGK